MTLYKLNIMCRHNLLNRDEEVKRNQKYYIQLCTCDVYTSHYLCVGQAWS